MMNLFRLLAVPVIGILSAVWSPHPAWVLLASGVLMVLLAAEEVTEEGRPRTMLRIAGGACALALAGWSGGWWGFTAVACVRLPAAVMIPGNAAAYLICAIPGWTSSRLSPLGGGAEAVGARRVAEILLTVVVLTAVTAMFALLQQLIFRRNTRKNAQTRRLQKLMLSEMRARQQSRELARHTYTAERNARLMERETISRNIHNNVGHSITAAVMTLDAADLLFESKPEEARRRMNEANERIRGSLESIRSAVRALDDESGEIPISDLRRYLDNIAEGFAMDTDRVVLRDYELYSDDISVPKEHAEFLTGVLQECLSNGARHGAATQYALSLRADAGHLQLSVGDNGKSDFNEDNSAERIAKGFGLKKIESYAQRCGGRVSFDNECGFRTMVELPLPSGGEGGSDVPGSFGG